MTSKKKPVPSFVSIEEEAEFWDTHDTTDYEWEPVAVRFAKNLSQGITVRFSSEALARLRATAHERGGRSYDAGSHVVLERLHEEKTSTTAGTR